MNWAALSHRILKNIEHLLGHFNTTTKDITNFAVPKKMLFTGLKAG